MLIKFQMFLKLLKKKDLFWFLIILLNLFSNVHKDKMCVASDQKATPHPLRKHT